jgi:hypothetical protein
MTQAKHILDRSYTSFIERTGGPPNKFIMNRATLEIICYEVFGDGRLYEGFTIGEDWVYKQVPIQLREDLKDFEIYSVYNCEGIPLIPSYAKKK